MLKFIAANLSDEDTLLARSMRESHKRRYGIPGGAIGLGWHIHRDNMTRWHNGMTGGYSTWLSVVPEFDVGVVVLANTATEKITELGLQLTSIVCGVTVEPPSRRKTVKGDPAVHGSYIGAYAITPQFVMTVTVEDGQLIVQATGQGKLLLDGISATKFSCRGVDAQISFVRDDDGKFNQLILHQNGIDQVAKRLEKMEAGPVEVKPEKGNPAGLESYVGDYAITPQFVMAVTTEDGQLMVQATGQGKLEFFPESPRKFFCKVVDAKITFMKGANGKVNRLILHQNGANQVAMRR
jgi:serine-type D-Ala-D-Ala carboxypeptidase/endopeptidase